MGSASAQGQLWGSRARDWAEVQEMVSLPFFEAILKNGLVREGTSLLDIGCGSGYFCQMAARRGAQVSGLDAALPLLAIARERVDIGDFRDGEMEELPFANQTFEVVTGLNCFQFAANPGNALREAARVTMAGGTVVIGTFGKPQDSDVTAYIAALRTLLPPLPTGETGPFALSSDGVLESLATQAGLIPGDIVEVDSPWDYPDERTMLRGMLSSGLAMRALQSFGQEVVREAVIKALAPFKTVSDGYLLRHKFRYMFATTTPKIMGNLQ